MDILSAMDLVLNNLEELDDTLFFKDILKNMQYTSISYLENVVKEITKFREAENRWPDFRFVKGLGGELVREDDRPFSKDVLVSLNRNLEIEARRAKAIMALQQGKEEEASSILEISKIVEDLPKPIMSNVSGLSIRDRYRIIKESPTRGLKFGEPTVDGIFRFATPGSVNLIAAPPKVGKTTFAFNSFYKNLMEKPVNLAYFGMEATETEMAFNLICAHSKKMNKPLSAFRLKIGELTEQEERILDEVEADFEKNKKGNYCIFEPKHLAKIQPLEMKNFIRDLIDEWGKLHGLYTDYIQLMKFYRPPGVANDEKSVMNFWVRWFHTMAVAEGYTQFLLSQVNREGEVYLLKKQEATTKLLAEANELERTSARTIVLFATPVMRENGQLKIFILQHRNGLAPVEAIDTSIDYEHFLVGEENFASIRTFDTLNSVFDVEDFGA